MTLLPLVGRIPIASGMLQICDLKIAVVVKWDRIILVGDTLAGAMYQAVECYGRGSY